MISEEENVLADLEEAEVSESAVPVSAVGDEETLTGAEELKLSSGADSKMDDDTSGVNWRDVVVRSAAGAAILEMLLICMILRLDFDVNLRQIIYRLVFSIRSIQIQWVIHLQSPPSVRTRKNNFLETVDAETESIHNRWPQGQWERSRTDSHTKQKSRFLNGHATSGTVRRLHTIKSE
jgi:hypothetical protein